MRNYFPLTDYDFYAYLTSGFTVLFALDYAVTGGALLLRESWTVVQVVLAFAVAYVAGQVVAIPSSIVLEHWFARTLLRPPTAILMDMGSGSGLESFIGKYLIGRYYSPFPLETRRRILQRAVDDSGASLTEVQSDPERVFGPAFSAARRDPSTATRLDEFRNQYGLNRNMAFSGAVSSVALAGRAAGSNVELDAAIAVLATVLTLGLVVRFLKFYSTYSAEILRTYAHLAKPGDP